MQIKATINFIFQRAAAQDCQKFGQPLGSFELLDCDGIRMAWINESRDDLAKQKAFDIIHGLMDATGYANFDIE